MTFENFWKSQRDLLPAMTIYDITKMFFEKGYQQGKQDGINSVDTSCSVCEALAADAEEDEMRRQRKF